MKPELDVGTAEEEPNRRDRGKPGEGLGSVTVADPGGKKKRRKNK
jgi:hypothetical protein